MILYDNLLPWPGSVPPSAKDNERSLSLPEEMTGRLAGVVHHLAKSVTSSYRHSLRLILGDVYVGPVYR